MAGNYPDAPSWRMAYDRDGTQVFVHNSTTGGLTQYVGAPVTALNNETTNTGTIGASNQANARNDLIFIFPELRDIDAFYMRATAFTYSVQVSADTTNGVDGTWTTLLSSYLGRSAAASPGYRNDITSTTALGVRALKVVGVTATGFGYNNVHLYGEPVPGANPNRLELWHPTLNEKLPPAWFDWGDSPRSSSADKTFRVKNLSASMTAGAARVAMESLTDTAPSVVAQHTLSYGGGSFLAQVNVGDLAPGAISGPVTLRRITPSNAVMGLWTFRVFSESTAWA